MKLYNYFRSSAGYRVRIALNLKGLDYDYVAVPLLKNAQQAPDYLALNPQGLVPTLDTGEMVISQSLAIIDYIDRTWPEPPLYPAAPALRARAMSFAAYIAAEIHSLNNLRVLRRLEAMGIDEAGRQSWYHHWIAEGLSALERMITDQEGPFCFGAAPTIADLFLVPQIFNARRFSCDLAPFPKLLAASDHAASQEAFARAAPEHQPDA